MAKPSISTVYWVYCLSLHESRLWVPQQSGRIPGRTGKSGIKTNPTPARVRVRFCRDADHCSHAKQKIRSDLVVQGVVSIKDSVVNLEIICWPCIRKQRVVYFECQLRLPRKTNFTSILEHAKVPSQMLNAVKQLRCLSDRWSREPHVLQLHKWTIVSEKKITNGSFQLEMRNAKQNLFAKMRRHKSNLESTGCSTSHLPPWLASKEAFRLLKVFLADLCNCAIRWTLKRKTSTSKHQKPRASGSPSTLDL